MRKGMIAAMLALGLSTVATTAFAQTDPGTDPNDPGLTTQQQTDIAPDTTGDTTTDGDGGGNMGLWGLVGLLGLAGLMGRSRAATATDYDARAHRAA